MSSFFVEDDGSGLGLLFWKMLAMVWNLSAARMSSCCLYYFASVADNELKDS